MVIDATCEDGSGRSCDSGNNGFAGTRRGVNAKQNEIQGSKLLQNVKKKTIDEKEGPGKMTLQSANLKSPHLESCFTTIPHCVTVQEGDTKTFFRLIPKSVTPPSPLRYI